MKHLLLVFHSQSRRNEQLALAAFEGALAADCVEVRLRRAMDADSTDLLWADAMLLLTPENFAAIAGGMKDLFDRVFYPLERAGKQALPYALVVDAGNGGDSCIQQLQTLLKGLRAVMVQPPMLLHGAPGEEELRALHELGEGFAAALEMGVF